MKITERKPLHGRGVWTVIVEADEGKRLYLVPEFTSPIRIHIVETTDPPPEWLKLKGLEPEDKMVALIGALEDAFDSLSGGEST